ncbi:MAG: YabP/YqfC family sporulation protein [Candidatus Coproplasma sp.]
MESSEQHILTVENCKKITATGIVSVDSFSPTRLTVTYSGGRISVEGAGMKITAFSKSTGSFCACGEINSVKYLGRGESLKKKLFK